MFSGFTREMPSFFTMLAMNNNRSFFEENRALYESAVLRPLTALAETLAPVVHEIDPLIDVRPSRSVSRIYRDIRFGKNKLPYRDYMWIGYRRVGETREETCGFYFDVSASAANWGCGYYHAQRPVMQNLRDRMLARPSELLRIIEDERFAASFDLRGDAYVRQFQPPEHLPLPLHALYPKKNIYAEHHLEDMEQLFSSDLADHIIEGFRVLAPFYALLRECMVLKAEDLA